MTHKDKELVFALRKCWAKHPELLLAATRIEKLNAKVEEWRTRHDNLLQSALEQARKDAMRIAELEGAMRELGYWFDTDQEILDAMTDADRADNARQLAKIRTALKETNND